MRADVVIGADGAASRVADVGRPGRPVRVLWGFALRAYLDDPVDAAAHRAVGSDAVAGLSRATGGCSPASTAGANVGLGSGMLADRTGGAAAARCFGAFLDHLRRLGVLRADRPRRRRPGRLGGWLKMGMVGTVPARGRVLLVGDAAGLVNPLQGEGIAQAMGSGRAAAEAVLAGPGRRRGPLPAAPRRPYGPYQSMTAAVHAALLPRPRAVSAVGRVVTAPGVGRVLAGGWSVFWNDLLAGATPGTSPHRCLRRHPPRARRDLPESLPRLVRRGDSRAGLDGRRVAAGSPWGAPCMLWPLSRKLGPFV